MCVNAPVNSHVYVHMHACVCAYVHVYIYDILQMKLTALYFTQKHRSNIKQLSASKITDIIFI